MLPGETPFRAVRRVVDEVGEIFGVDIELEMEGGPNGPTRVETHFLVDTFRVDVFTEDKWQRIVIELHAIAERALQGDGG